MIFIIFLIGFSLGIAYSIIGENLPLLIPEVPVKESNSWILNLFIACLNAVVLLVSFYLYGLSYEFFSSALIMGIIMLVFITDFKYMIILDSPLIIGSILAFILKAYYYGFKSALLALLSGLILFIFMLIIGFIGRKIFKRDALGGGDIKLSGVIGIILGLRLGLCAIIISSLLAMPYALASLMLSKNREVPFGPFLAGSMGLVYLFSDKFMNLINFLF